MVAGKHGALRPARVDVEQVRSEDELARPSSDGWAWRRRGQVTARAGIKPPMILLSIHSTDAVASQAPSAHWPARDRSAWGPAITRRGAAAVRATVRRDSRARRGEPSLSAAGACADSPKANMIAVPPRASGVIVVITDPGSAAAPNSFPPGARARSCPVSLVTGQTGSPRARMLGILD